MQILIVEDDPDQLETLSDLLRHAGHDVVTATDGHAALLVFDRQRPKCAIVDLVMPRMGGVELIRQLRREIGKDALLLVLTGAATEEACQSAQQAGADHVLSKPLRVPLLFSLLDRQVAAADLRRTARNGRAANQD